MPRMMVWTMLGRSKMKRSPRRRQMTLKTMVPFFRGSLVMMKSAWREGY
jgi:hypothetical protein